MQIAFLDIAIIVVYILLVLGIGIYLAKGEGAEGFFLNNKKTKKWFLVFTVLSTNVGAGTVIGVIGSAYNTGISFALTFFILSLLGWIVLIFLTPRIKKWADENNAYTLGDYFNVRYSDRNRRIVGYVLIIAYILWTSAQFIAFATLINVILGINFMLALIVTSVLTILYTSISGIKGDFYTDAIQFFVMFPVFIFLIIKILGVLSFGDVFAVPELHYNIYNYSGPVFFYMGVLLGFPLLISSMEIWQRIFAAEDAKTARSAFVWSAILKLGIIVLTVFIGFGAYKILPEGLDADSVLFELMKELLPTGLLGLGFASMLAIIMSTVDSMIMVGSATLTKDFYLRKYPDREDKTLKVGRISAAVFGLVALIVAIIAPDVLQVVIIASQMALILSPAILFGLLSKKKNERGAFWSILLGTITIIPFLFIDPNIAGVPAIIVSVITFFIFYKVDKKTIS